MTQIQTQLRIARCILRAWPFARGRSRMEQLLLAGFNGWPQKGDFSFKYGSFVDANLDPWPKGYRELFLVGAMEEAEVRIWKKVLRGGGIVIDGGANLGYWSLVGSSLVGEDGKVVAFEPIPQTAIGLRKNLQASHVTNVEVHQQALSNASSSVTIHLAADDPIGGQSSIVKSPRFKWADSVEVQCMRLDQLSLPGDRLPSLVKLDVEGGELHALLGAESWFSKDGRPVVTFEWNEETARLNGYSPTEILKMLAAYGYDFYLASQKGLRKFAIRRDIEQWTPMVWCFTKEQLVANRLTVAL